MAARSLVAGLALFPSALGCAPDQPAPAGPGPSATVTAIRISGLSADAAVVGVPEMLVVVGRGAGGGEKRVPTVVWSSSDASVARIDATGALSPLAPGATIITAEATGHSATLAIDVVPNLAGTWSLTFRSTGPCDQDIGCPTPPVPRNGGVKLTQHGRSVQGDWHGVSPQGHPPLSGHANADGTFELSGSDCFPGDTFLSRLYTVRDWRMHPDGDAFAGRFVWERRSGRSSPESCYSELSTYSTLEYVVTGFRRQ